jgi:hypothetical protein
VQRIAVATAALLAVLAPSCGSRPESSSSTTTTPNLVRNETTVGRLPREPFAVGEGNRRVVLEPTKDKTGELCVSASIAGKSGTQRRCLGPGLPNPLVAFVGLGGKSAKRVDWTSLIGLARADVDHVVLRLQSGPPRTLELRHWPGFRWSGLSLEPDASGTDVVDLLGTREVNRPNELIAYDAKGRTLMHLELSWVYGPCEQDPPCNVADPDKEWQDVQDPYVGASGAASQPSRRAEELVLRDPLVTRLLDGRRYAFMPSSDWQDCDGSSIGVVLEVNVSDPITYEGDFPFVSFNHKSGKPYFEGVWHLAVRNATLLDISVDLRRNRVVMVDPTAGENVQVDQAKFHIVKEPAEPDDNLDCEGNPIGD